MNNLMLGNYDTGKKPADISKYLQPYHYIGLLTGENGRKYFRDDDRTEWRKFTENKGTEVSDLQKFLFQAGFMPRGVVDGIFDYVTLAATRLFQEYVRTVEGEPSMIPDGMVGGKTWKNIDRWKAAGKKADWVQFNSDNPSPRYKRWMELLKKAKSYYRQSGNPILKQVEQFKGKSDTRAPDAWSFDPQDIHLIGVRRKQDTSSDRRENDDIFILLINGIVFEFWGSTDPNQSIATDRKDEAFLVEGQHKYRFAWHKVSSESKIYRALRPYQYGVLVFRDRDDDNALTQADLNKGLDPSPNTTINIHWSGIGSTNLSAGCQVIAGQSYINHQDKAVDCAGFAANKYSELNDDNRKTKAAYNVLADLVLSFARPGVDHLLYTLGRESNLSLDAHLPLNYASDTLHRMKDASTINKKV